MLENPSCKVMWGKFILGISTTTYLGKYCTMQHCRSCSDSEISSETNLSASYLTLSATFCSAHPLCIKELAILCFLVGYSTVKILSHLLS